MYVATDWYWLADDGRLYSSAEQRSSPRKSRPMSHGGPPISRRRGQRDGAGEQTDAALRDVLAPYGLWTDLYAYAADKRWRVEVGGI